MTVPTAYSSRDRPYCRRGLICRLTIVRRLAACLILLITLSTRSFGGLHAPDYHIAIPGPAIPAPDSSGLSLKDSMPMPSLKADPGDPEPPYDEIFVFMNVQGVGMVQMPAAIRNQLAYLSVTDVFNYLKIKNSVSARMDSVSGFFISQQAPYLIDQKHNRIFYQGKTFTLGPDDMIHTEANLYLRTDYFGQIFGLDCQFNFRSLSIVLSTKLELPVVREMRQQQMRDNIGRLRGDIKADTTIYRSYSLFRFGMADWSEVVSQDINGVNDTRLNLALGAVVAGGETNVSLNYDNSIPFREREQFYQWHYVDNDRPGLRQVTAGKIATPSISTLYYPVAGVQFTNTPTTFRRSFGSYTLSNRTEPGWTVELYVNNELVNYKTADASGFFTFQVPLVYGTSTVRLRFYGLYGEERSSEQTFQIPFNFLPDGEFEYNATAGVEEDSLHSRFGRASFNYGLSRYLTVGAGLEYLSSVTTGRFLPFVNASFRATPFLVLAADYVYGVRSKFVASYHLPSDFQVELDYTRYKQGQQAINNTYLEERKAVISFPLRNRKFSAFSRLTVYQILLPGFKLPNSKYTTVEELISGSFYGVSTNFTTYALIDEPASPYLYSTLSLGFRLPGKILFTPQVQYAYSTNKFIGMRTEFGKYVNARGYVNIFYEKNYQAAFRSIGLGFRYDLPVAQLGSSFRHTNGISTVVESASGSLLYDDRIKYLGISNHSSVGRGGIIILPFLDLNNNGIRDRDEPKVEGLRIQMNSGRTIYSKADTIIRVSELEAYANYTIRLTAQFENITWQIRNKTIDVAVDPNQFKIIEVPVTVMGEVSGFVYLNGPEGQKAQGRILIYFYRSDSARIGQVITEADGSFDFTGLTPGNYTARVDEVQMKKLGLTASPRFIPFTIHRSKEGDAVDGLQFILLPRPGHTADKAPGNAAGPAVTP